MFEIVWPWAWLLLPLPIIVRKLSTPAQQKEHALKVPFLSTQANNVSQQKRAGKIQRFSIILIWLLLLTGLSRPQWLGDPISIPNEGRDLMVAVDLSGSMRIEDMEINRRNVDRLVMIKYVMKDFIKRRVGDRIGLILFADTAYQQTPLTYDRETVNTLLLDSEIGLVGDKTAIGDAIGLAVKRFEEKEESNRVLILLTDGQNTAGNLSPDEGLTLAKQKGVTVYTIGVGADVMMQQTFFGQRQINPSKELDEAMLSRIAEETGGLYFRAKNTEGLAQIYQALDKLEPVARETQEMRPLRSLFHYPLTLAFGIAVLLLTPSLWSGFISVMRYRLGKS